MPDYEKAVIFDRTAPEGMESRLARFESIIRQSLAAAGTEAERKGLRKILKRVLEEERKLRNDHEAEN